ncbi:MAG: PAS domain S-box protein [Nitrospirae bacterium]|nr:PAS domain S-box protein [Nitrospirota bacterium]
MNDKLQDLIDIPKFQDLLKSVSDAFAFPVAITYNESPVPSALEMADNICTKFHRRNPLSQQECRRSEKHFLSHAHAAKGIVVYRCILGMVDVAVPIIIGGKHMGNIFAGQLLLEEPSLPFFRNQAREYGFNEDDYMEALSRVQVLTTERLQQNLTFMQKFAEMLGDVGLKRIKEMEAEKELRLHKEHLEELVLQRTEAMESINARLVDEINWHDQMEDVLLESEERFRMIAENITEVFWMADVEIGKMFYVSPAYEHIWGRTVASLYENPRSFSDAIYEKDSSRVLACFEAAKTNRQPFDQEYRIIRPDGSIRWIWDRGFPVADMTGRVTRYAGVARDVTKRKQVEQALRDSEGFLESIVENIPDMIFVKDAKELRFVRFNKSGEALLGYRREELIGRNDYAFFPKDEANFFTEKDREVIDTKQLVEIAEETILTKHLGARILHTKKIPILDGEGNTRYLLGISEDITDKKNAMRELAEAKEAAIAASKAKSDFLANMSHELRTPLNSIIGFSEVLEDEIQGPLNDSQRQNLRYIHKAGLHLLSLINDILDLAKVESGKIELEYETVRLKELLYNSLAMHREKAVRNGISLDIEMPPGGDISIEADERKLKQILFNLLSNAVKFTPTGGSVRIAVKTIPANPPKMEKCSLDESHIEVSVTDTGIGIKPEDIPRLFKEFSQLESTYDKKYEGTGLGLSLTKKLVELHNGRIWVESTAGKGSRFVFTMPVKQ